MHASIQKFRDKCKLHQCDKHKGATYYLWDLKQMEEESLPAFSYGRVICCRLHASDAEEIVKEKGFGLKGCAALTLQGPAVV